MSGESDRSIRKLVAELATETQSDIEAVLDALDERAQIQVRSLLSEYAGRGLVSEPLSKRGSRAVKTHGLSPWLSARLHASPDGDGRFAMTPAALDALRSLAVSLPGTDVPLWRDNLAQALVDLRRVAGDRLQWLRARGVS